MSCVSIQRALHTSNVRSVRNIMNMHVPKKIKTSLKHYFSGFWSEYLNLIEDTWQTQHKRSRTYGTYMAYDFMPKILWPKKQTGSNIYIVSRSLTRTQIKCRQKKFGFKNGNIAQNIRQTPWWKQGVRGVGKEGQRTTLGVEGVQLKNHQSGYNKIQTINSKRGGGKGRVSKHFLRGEERK